MISKDGYFPVPTIKRDSNSFPPRRVPVAGIIQIRFEGSRAAPGSQETSPRDDHLNYTILFPSPPPGGEAGCGGEGYVSRCRPSSSAPHEGDRAGGAQVEVQGTEEGPEARRVTSHQVYQGPQGAEGVRHVALLTGQD